MGEVVEFPQAGVAACPGNGAREALVEVASGRCPICGDKGTGGTWADWILAELWVRGYKVVPLSAADDPEDGEP